MSDENTTEAVEDTKPERITPDKDTFDFEAWLSTGDAGRAKESITVYNDLSLVREAEDLAREIERHNAKADAGVESEDLAVGEKSKSAQLEERQAELETQIDKAKAVVEVTSWSDAEAETILAEFKEKHPDEKRQPEQTVKGTCLLLSHVATVNGKRLTVDQWERMSEHIAGGQWQRIKQVQLKVQSLTPRADSPFSRTSSRLPEAVRRS